MPIFHYKVDLLKLQLLKLVGENEDLAFTEIDEILGENNKKKVNPPYFLYKTAEREELVYAFYYERNLELVLDLIKAKALLIQGTSNLRVVRRQPLYPSTAEKLLFLLKNDKWRPTVLIKGQNYKDEMERLTNDTSRKIKESINRQQESSTTEAEGEADDLHTH